MDEDEFEYDHEPNVTTLLLTGGHRVTVKTPREETVEERLAQAGWPVIYYEQTNGYGDTPHPHPNYSYEQPSWAVFERPHGRKPVRIRTDTVAAIL